MWKCKNCGEETDNDEFVTCWNCQYSKDGEPPVVDEPDPEPVEAKSATGEPVLIFEAGKWCPKCGEINGFMFEKCRNRKCAYVFRGNEIGAMVKPVCVETESKKLDQAIVADRVSALSDEPPQTTISWVEEFDVLTVTILKSGALFVIGLLLIGFGYFAFQDSKAGESNIPALIALLGIGGCLVALGSIARKIWWMIHRPRFTEPKQVTDVFYDEMMPDGRSARTEDKGSCSRAFSALDSTAQGEFGSAKDFEQYWTNREAELKRWAIRSSEDLLQLRPTDRTGRLECAMQLRSDKISDLAGNTATFKCEMLVVPYELAAAGKDLAGNQKYVAVHYRVFSLPQIKTLIKGQDRWYLTSGTLDGPQSWSSPAEVTEYSHAVAQA